MLFKAPVPAKLPHLQTIIDDLGQPLKRLAHFLDVSPTTMARYIKAGQAPRAVMLALYWETRWGQGAAYCDLHQWGSLHAQTANALKRENELLRAQIQKLHCMLDQEQRDCANSPLLGQLEKPPSSPTFHPFQG